MASHSEWPLDNLGFPYGYYTLFIQKDGFRLDCNGSLIPLKSYKELYDVLGKEQEKLIKKRPKTLEEAFIVTLEGNPVEPSE